jgi:acetyl-CoA C-acetyltransferase
MPVLVGGVRTPFGKFGGRLTGVGQVQLGVMVLRESMVRAKTLSSHDVTPQAVVVGIGCFEGGLFVPARQIAVESGLATSTPSVTLDRACCSGMTAIGAAWRDVRLGLRSVVGVVGVESLSTTPYLMPQTRWGVRRGDITLTDPLAFRSPLAGDEQIAKYTGEMAVRHGYGRVEQDEWAIISHERYGAALHKGLLDPQVLPWCSVVTSSDDDGRGDEQYRPDASIEALSRLKPVYGSPTVTAGNAPGLNDGAAGALIVDGAIPGGIQDGVGGSILDYFETAGDVTAGVIMPGRAILEVLKRNRLGVSDIHVFEINEAYAATVLCSTLEIAGGDEARAVQIRQRTNIWGGAIASGHPLGASGMRITLNAIDILHQRGGGYAVAAVCGGFGQVDAVLIKVS